MRTELLALDELTDADRAAWRDLAGQAVEPNPFFEEGFVLPAAAHLAADELPALLVVRDDGGWRVSLPVLKVRRGRRFPFPMVKTWRHLYSFLGSPHVDPVHADVAVHALVSSLGRHGIPRFLLLEQVGDD